MNWPWKVAPSEHFMASLERLPPHGYTGDVVEALVYRIHSRPEEGLPLVVNNSKIYVMRASHRDLDLRIFYTLDRAQATVLLLDIATKAEVDLAREVPHESDSRRT